MDNKLEFTPYRLKKGKHAVTKVFTDHVGIKWSMSVEPCSNKTNKVVQWNYSKKDGGFKYADKTDSLSDYITCKLMECDDVDEIAKFAPELRGVPSNSSFSYFPRASLISMIFPGVSKNITDQTISKSPFLKLGVYFLLENT